jgi:predicted nucleotidyltransferase
MAASIVDALRRALAARREVRVAVLFGSAARGTMTETSDVDLAVDAPGVDRCALAGELSLALDREVDVVDLSDPGVPLLEELVRDGVVVHESEPGRGATWRSRALAILETDRPWYARMRDAWVRRVAERGLT